MADQIKVSTEQLAQIAQKLRALQDDIAEAEQVLNGVNSIQGGWDLIKINISIKGKNCNTSGDAVDALRQAYLQLKNGMGDTAQKTEQASRLFEDAEKDISQLLGDMNKKEGLLARDILLGQALGYKRIGKEHTPYDDIRDTNPRYKEGKEYQINCMRCAVAYELRRRGYDVEAMPYMPFYTLKTRWKEFDISSFVMLFSP